MEKRRPEDRVLKSTEGHFKNGILDVKHLLRGTPSRNNDLNTPVRGKGKKKGKGKNHHGKKKGGYKKRH